MVQKKKRLSAPQRRAQLIEVGRGVFAERGYDGTSVEELAAAARISKPVLYEHFGGKEGLYTAIVEREINEIAQRIEDAITEGSARARLERAVAAFLGYVKDEPAGFAVLRQDSPLARAGGGMSSLLPSVAKRVSGVFIEMFGGAGYPPEIAPLYAQALIGMVSFVGQWWTETGTISVEQATSHLSAMAWLGLRGLPKAPDVVRVGSE